MSSVIVRELFYVYLKLDLLKYMTHNKLFEMYDVVMVVVVVAAVVRTRPLR